MLSVNPLGIVDDTPAVIAPPPVAAAAAPANANTADKTFYENLITRGTVNDSGFEWSEDGFIIRLHVGGRNLTGELDVSGLTNLRELYCYNNQLSSLNAQGLTNLQALDCDCNQLSSLNVQGLTNLRYLDCYGNQLSSLNVQGLTNLQELYCDGNQLSSLNVQGLTNLQWLDCDDNQLSSLYVQGLTNLQYLDCYGNQLSSLNVQGLTNLQSLHCAVNQLSSLNVQGLTNLQSLACYDNQLSSLNVQGLTNLRFLYCHDNQLSSLNVQGLTNLQYLACHDNDMQTLYLSMPVDNFYSIDYTDGNPNIEVIVGESQPEPQDPVDLSDKFTLAVVEESVVTGKAIKLQLTCNDLASIAGQYATLNIESLQVQQILADGSIFSDTITKAQLDEGGKFPTVIDLKGTFANGILWESDYYRCKDPGTLEFTLNCTLSESGISGSVEVGGPVTGLSIAPPVANGENAPVAMAKYESITSKNFTVKIDDLTILRDNSQDTDGGEYIVSKFDPTTKTFTATFRATDNYSDYRVAYWYVVPVFTKKVILGKATGTISIDVSVNRTYKFKIYGRSTDFPYGYVLLDTVTVFTGKEAKSNGSAYPLTSAFAAAGAAETAPVAVTNEQVVKTGEAELANALQIAATVEVPESGVYHVRGFLFGQDGETVVASVSKDSLSLNAGSANALTFDFDGKDILRSGIDGPYIFGIEVWVEDESAVMCDYAIYATAEYDHAAFEGTAATLTGTYSDTGVDLDSDGKFDKLTVNVGVNAIRAGNYNVTVYLKDGNGKFAGYGSTTAALTSGLHDVAVNFNALLLTSGGQWVVDWIQISDADSGDVFDVLNDTYTTKAYVAAQFTNPGAVFTGGNSVQKQGNLVFTLPVAVATAGDYTLSATLHDGSNNVIRQVEKTYNLTANSTALTYEVLAADIVAGNFNGPYKLSNIILRNENSDIVSTFAPIVSEAYTWQDFVAPPTAPATPEGLAASDVTKDSLTLSWTAVDGVTYTLQQYNGTGWNTIANPNAAGTTVNGLTANTPYQFRLKATKDSLDSDYATVTVTTLADTPPITPTAPATPTDFIAGTITETMVALSWTAVDGASYVVQYKEGTDGAWGSTNVAINGTTAMVTSLKAGTTYYFQVKAVNAGVESPVAVTNATTTDATKQQPPNNVKVDVTDGKETKSATVTWTAPAGADAKTAYVIEYWDVTNPSKVKKVTVKAKKGAALTDTISKDLALKSGVEYGFKVSVKGASEAIETGTLRTYAVVPTATLATLKAKDFPADFVSQNSVAVHVKNYLSATHSIGKAGKDVAVDTLTVTYTWGKTKDDKKANLKTVTLTYNLETKEWVADSAAVTFNKDGIIVVKGLDNGLSAMTKYTVTVKFSQETGNKATSVKATSKVLSTTKTNWLKVENVKVTGTDSSRTVVWDAVKEYGGTVPKETPTYTVKLWNGSKAVKKVKVSGKPELSLTTSSLLKLIDKYPNLTVTVTTNADKTHVAGTDSESVKVVSTPAPVV
ncbi:hypothetical protein FACS1894170_04350 [Planctomycetales bacterium]|nr:hypothetical protein FACS1894170_04350 [Planctomycetales bacterium]